MRILYVEDNMANLFLVKRVARLGNHEVINYIDGEEALANVGNDKPDLVLMDIQLAGVLSGLDVVKKMRAAGHTMPVIAVTAYAMLGDRERCIEAGCNDYVAKPLPIAQLSQMFAHYASLMPDAPAAETAPVSAPAPEAKSETTTSEPAAAAKPETTSSEPAAPEPTSESVSETGTSPVVPVEDTEPKSDVPRVPPSNSDSPTESSRNTPDTEAPTIPSRPADFKPETPPKNETKNSSETQSPQSKPGIETAPVLPSKQDALHLSQEPVAQTGRTYSNNEKAKT
jgi:two-component system cell cycle response regulator DivK